MTVDKRIEPTRPVADREEIMHEGAMLALILRSSFRQDGIHFFTPGHFSQQLAYMQHPSGKLIAPHYHNPIPREVTYTQEVLVIRRGRLRVDFYTREPSYLESRILEAGDVILLAGGGHGFEVLEELEMIEIKQGPYFGDEDKTRFAATATTSIRLP